MVVMKVQADVQPFSFCSCKGSVFGEKGVGSWCVFYSSGNIFSPKRASVVSLSDFFFLFS